MEIEAHRVFDFRPTRNELSYPETSLGTGPDQLHTHSGWQLSLWSPIKLTVVVCTIIERISKRFILLILSKRNAITGLTLWLPVPSVKPFQSLITRSRYSVHEG